MKTEEERYEAYLICQQRGHSPSGYTTTTTPPKMRCRWCETYFWTETLLRESGAPQPKEG